MKETERGFQGWFVEYALLNRWLVYHPVPARPGSGKWVTAFLGSAGFPDNVCLRDGVCIVAELKVGKNPVTEGQGRWLDAFRLVPGISVYVWKPEDRPEIARVLGPPGPR